MCVCVCMFVCVCGGGGGFCHATSLLVIPGYWVTALQMARRGSVGLASLSFPCSSHDVPKTIAFKTKFTVKSKSQAFLQIKQKCSKNRLACWNVQSAGSLSAQSFKLQQIIETMTNKNIDLLALSQLHWQGHGITQVQSCTILYSGSESSHSRGVAIVLSPHACCSWEAAGSVFKPINNRIVYICLKSLFLYYRYCRLCSY